MIGSEYGYGIRDLASGTAPYSVFILIYIKMNIKATPHKDRLTA